MRPFSDASRAHGHSYRGHSRRDKDPTRHDNRGCNNGCARNIAGRSQNIASVPERIRAERTPERRLRELALRTPAPERKPGAH